MLASTSPYRRQLLQRFGYPFDVVAPNLDETPLPGEAPAATALRLAEAKARAVAARLDDALVLGSDQVADADGVAISKPGDHRQALAQLHSLSGRTIVFHTAVALVDAASGRCQTRLVDAVEDRISLDPSDRIDIEDLKEVMNGAILRLPSRERLVIALYYYEELTLKEIGSILNVSESRISQIHVTGKRCSHVSWSSK